MSPDFEPEIQELADIMRDFMNTQIIPAEQRWAVQRDELGLDCSLPIVDELRRKSSRRGLWNLLQPQAAGITHVESAMIARITGWSPLLAPESINSQDPDYGNMNVLEVYASEFQSQTWLEPLLDGATRSAWAMTEPAERLAERTPGAVTATSRGEEYLLNGHLNFVAGIADDPGWFMVFLAQTAPANGTGPELAAFFVPIPAAGVAIETDIDARDYLPQLRLSRVTLSDVSVSHANVLGAVGDGARVLGSRLRLGRINRAMRSLGMADRALSNVAHQDDPHEQASAWLRQCALVIDAVQDRILALAARLDNPSAKMPCNAEISHAAEEAHSLALSISREANNYLKHHRSEDAELITYFEDWIIGMRSFDAADAVNPIGIGSAASR